MRSHVLAVFVVFLTLCADESRAQTAFRCDQDGKTVYSDKPCPAAKAVAPTQDSVEQKAAAKSASEQMRKDNADLSKRLSEREKLEAQERAAMRKASTSKAKDTKEPKGKKTAAGKSKSAKKKSADKKSKKNDNKVSSTS